MQKKKKTARNKPSSQNSTTTLLVISILVILILIGCGLISISFLETAVHEKKVVQEVHSFQQLVSVYKSEAILSPEPEEPENKQDHYEQLYTAMEAYNQGLFENGQTELKDAWSYQAEVFDLANYGYALDAVGVVRIPDIEVEMPLYLGASYDNLSKGFAQLSQTSMPIGGENTNCVIAGHRGWKGMPYMRDVEMLEIGDRIFVENPWETMEYRISEIILIDPWDTKCIYIKPGRDVLTLFTCHPYGVGSHRYVLICDRYLPPDQPNISTSVPSQGRWEWEWQTHVNISTSDDTGVPSSRLEFFINENLPWLCVCAACLLLDVILIIFLLPSRKRKRRKKGKYCR